MTTHHGARWRTDGTVALVAVLVCAGMGLLGQPDWWWSAAMAATLTVRRTLPLVFAVSAATISGMHFALDASLLMPGDLVLLVAAYSVAAHAEARSRHVVLVLGAVFVGALGVRTVFDSTSNAPGSDALVVGMVAASLVASWTIGLLERRKADVLRDAEHRRMLSERDADARTQLAAFEERERISDDIHDILAHTLTSVVVQAESGRVTAPDPEVAELFATISASSRAALHEVRSLLAPTNEPAIRPTPGLDDLDDLVESFSTTGLNVEFEQQGPSSLISEGMALATYRVVQESLTNALRHGRGDTAHIVLKWAPDVLMVTATNPIESGSMHQPIRPHRGLAGIQRRCALYGGEAMFECSDVFTVVAIWPLLREKDGAAS